MSTWPFSPAMHLQRAPLTSGTNRTGRTVPSGTMVEFDCRVFSGGPKAAFTVENVSAAPPGQQKIVVQDVSFALQAGNAVGVIGPSASGKSSLVRLLVGVWSPLRGKVRLDGAALEQWDPEALGEHIGYLPQDVELFAGTVAQNIAR